MPLSQEEFDISLDALFHEANDPADSDLVANAAIAFQNLALYFVEVQAAPLLPLVRIDNTRLAIMLKRFYREAFGVKQFTGRLRALEMQGHITEEIRTNITRGVRRLGIRLNSQEPKKTRIAAAFSLWMATLKPIYLEGELPAGEERRAWRLDATINFWIVRKYLMQFGATVIGNPSVNPKDTQARIRRIFNDLTYRDLTLSSLEFMYAFIFVPRSGLREPEDELEMELDQ